MLKILACLFMLLDHIGFYYSDVLPDSLVTILRTVGRLAFPIFAWYVARGYARTRTIFVYFLRMVLFATVSEIIIRFAHSLIGYQLYGTNVLVTFALSIVLLAGWQIARHSWRDVVVSLKPIPAASGTLPVNRIPTDFKVRINLGGIELDPRIGLPLGSLMMFLALLAAIGLQPDYEIYGMLMVLFFYIAMDRRDEIQWEKRIWLFMVPLNLAFMVYRIVFDQTQPAWAILQLFSLLSVPLLLKFIHEKKPPVWAKYAFYLFYPLHILALCALRLLMP